jgi:hypothetical protein
MGIRVLAFGGRTYSNCAKVYRALDAINAKHGVSCIIEGDAPGADRLAKLWALDRGVLLETYPANWRKEGRAAGPKRNERMLREGRPDVGVAFGGDAGTADMVRRMKGAGIAVWEIDRG